MLSGLSHAHEHGIIHRDIKPANIVVSQKSGLGDHVKILDFGLARFREESSNLTGGVVVGTPSYMAPEQIAGQPIDQRTDLYACGVMLFELLTGVKPFTAPDPVGVCMKHLKEPPPRLSDVAKGRTFGALEDVVARALEKIPSNRYTSAQELSQALLDATSRPSQPKVEASTIAEASEPSTVLERPAATKAPRNGMGLIAVIAVAVIGASAGGAYLIKKHSGAEPAKDDTASEPVAVEKPAETPTPASADAVDELVARAVQLSSGGQREAAIDLLVKARKTYPEDARVPYNLAKLYLEKMWWADGLKHARAALALDPKLKNDPDLIKLALRGFNTTKSYDWTLARFLHDDIGDAAKPYLEDTAKNHQNPIVRSRAAAELRRYK